jgi:hypothetical protein
VAVNTPTAAPPSGVAPLPAQGGRRALLKRWLVAAVLLAPLAAEAALRNTTPRQWLTIGAVYLLAVLLFAALAPRSTPPPDAVLAGGERVPKRRALLAVLALALLALQLYLGATGDLRSWTLVWLWLAGIAVWIAAWAPRPRLPALSLPQVVLLGVVLVVAALARLWDLENFQYVHGDEFVLAHIALRRAWATIQNPSQGFPAFVMADHDGNSQLVMGSFRRLAAFWLFGISFAGLRFPSAFFGLLEVVLVFFIGRQMFGFRAGLAAAAVMAPLTVHLAFSRHGDDNVEGSVVWTLVALFLARGVARRSPAMLAFAGASLSLALYSYLSSRPAVLAVPLFLLMAALDPRLRGRWLGWGTLALLGGFAVAAGPVLVTYYRQPSIFFYNAQVTSWLGAAIAAFRASGNVADLLPIWEHFSKALMAYNVVDSADHHYWPKRGLFTWLPAALLYAGLALACLRLFDWRYRLLALWFWAPTIGISMMSDYPPPVHRILPAVPVCALLIGLGFDKIVTAWESLGPWLRRAAGPVAGVALTAAVAHEGAFYFTQYSQWDLEPWENALSRYVLTLPPGQQVSVMQGRRSMVLPLYFATNLGREHPYEFFGRPVDQLPSTSLWSAAIWTQVNVYSNPSGDLLPSPTLPPPGVTYLVHTDRREWLPLFRDAYPGGRETQLISPDPNLADQRTHHQPSSDPVMWTAYSVDAAEVARHLGLDLTIRDARGETTTQRVTSLATPALPAGLTYPVELEWRGWFHSHPIDNEPSTFYTTGTVTPTLRLADVNVALSTAGSKLKVAAGGTPLHARARLETAQDTVGVEWDGVRRRSREPFPIGQAAVWPGQPRVVVDWLSRDGAQLLRRDYDVMMAHWHLQWNQPTHEPVLIRWSGELDIRDAGVREFELAGDGPVRLMIDERQVWPAAAGRHERPGGVPDTRRVRVPLEAGRHRVVLERIKTEGSQVALHWRQRDEPFVLVPKDAFAPVAWP